MKVPNRASAIVDERKLRDYLLSRTHPVGRSKARFLAGLGYHLDDSDRLGADLRAVLSNDVLETIETQYGRKYVVPGGLAAPDGSIKSVVTVWIVLSGTDVPRFITEYPGGDDED